MASAVFIIIGFYMIWAGALPLHNWGFLRGPYSGTGKWLDLHPVMGRISGVLLLVTGLAFHIADTVFFIMIGVSFLTLIVSMIWSSRVR
ncbi:hypothetical protein GF324_14260 [bacterium]|nr:hypothetical protein [bacterium]